MEAPNKIHLERGYPDNGTLPGGVNYYPSPSDITYIRKDAIMEWAKEGKEHYRKLMEDFPDETSFAASFGAYNAFIEKLNSL